MRAPVIAALLLGGCTLYDAPPDRSCRTSNDCFRAQGEICNTATRRCEVPPDAAPLEQAEDDPIDVASEEVADE